MQQDIDKLQKVYQLFVEPPNETVSATSLSDLFKFAGYTVTDSKMNEIMLECSENGLKFEQFKSICSKLEGSEITREEFENSLKKLSGDDSGYIEVNSLMTILKSQSYSLSEDEIDEVLTLFKPNSEGKISIDYMLSIMFK